VPEYIYSLRAVRKAHGDKVVLDNVTLSFLPGAKIGVVGPNGTGKSTLLKIMAGKDEPSSGVAELAPGASVGLLEQEPELDPAKDVRGNVEDGVRPLRDLLDRFNEISAAFAEPDADFDTLLAEQAKAGYDTPVLMDSYQLVGESLGVTRSAEVIVINPKTWTVTYRGAVSGLPAAIDGPSFQASMIIG